LAQYPQFYAFIQTVKEQDKLIVVIKPIGK
jgi:hypothetical protein